MLLEADPCIRILQKTSLTRRLCRPLVVLRRVSVMHTLLGKGHSLVADCVIPKEPSQALTKAVCPFKISQDAASNQRQVQLMSYLHEQTCMISQTSPLHAAAASGSLPIHSENYSIQAGAEEMLNSKQNVQPNCAAPHSKYRLQRFQKMHNRTNEFMGGIS